jgi:hypothetical protein
MGTVAGHGNFWAVWTQMALIAPGTNNLCSVSMKSQATAHAVGPECDMGRWGFALHLATGSVMMLSLPLQVHRQRTNCCCCTCCCCTCCCCSAWVRFGRGEFAAAISSMRAMAQVVGPALWGRAYMQLLRVGYPPSLVWVCVAGLGALVPAVVHRSIAQKDWEPKQVEAC